MTQTTVYTLLKQIQHSVDSDKNEPESFDLGRGLRNGTETWGIRVEVSGSGLKFGVSIADGERPS